LIVHFYSGMAKERGIGSCLIFRIWDKDSRVLEGSEYFNIGFKFSFYSFVSLLSLAGVCRNRDQNGCQECLEITGV